MRAPLVVAVAALAIGIALGLHGPALPGGGPFFFLASGAAALAVLGGLTPGRARARRPGDIASRLLLLLFLLAGGLLGLATRTAAARSCLHQLPGERSFAVRGQVIERHAGGRLRLLVERFEDRGGWRACDATIPARWEGEGLEPGTGFEGRGRWWTPPDATALLGRPGTLLLDTARAGEVGAAPLGVRLRQAGRSRIDAIFERRAPVAASLLLAQRAGLDPELRERFARAGLSHLLAISGLHVGLLAGIMLLLGRAARLSRRGAAIAAAAGTVAYVALIGAPDSAVRAALQILLVLAARAVQRPTRTESLIAAAALALLVADPGALLRPGFQLSFAGVSGILLLRRPLLARLGLIRRRRVAGRRVGAWLADGLATSAAATLATAPVVAWHFGRVPVVGVLANLVAIPLLAAVVPALALSLTAGWVWLPAGRFLAGGAEILLDALDATAEAAAAVPGGSVTAAPMEVLPLTAAVGTGWWVARRLGRIRGTVRSLAWVGVAASVMLVAPLRPPGGGLEVHHIDVGQGDATAIRSPAGRWLLIDAGVATDDYDAGALRVVPYLRARGVRRLAGLVVTHPDADHMGGAVAVLTALRPSWVGGPGVVVGKGQYLELLSSAKAAGIPWVALHRGVELELDGVLVSVLWPDGSASFDDANDASVVTRIAYGEFQALLTGDAPAVVERRLVDRHGDALEAELLKVGHHGSATSTTAELLANTGARVAVISAGRRNRYGHPHPEVLARIRHRGLEVFRTDRHGSIVVHGRPDGSWRVETQRGRSD
jgi:competence protein ComEC